MDTFKGIIKSADFNVFIPTDDTHGTLAFYCYYTIPLINMTKVPKHLSEDIGQVMTSDEMVLV